MKENVGREGRWETRSSLEKKAGAPYPSAPRCGPLDLDCYKNPNTDEA